MQSPRKDIQHRDTGGHSVRMSHKVHHKKVWKYRQPRYDVIVDFVLPLDKLDRKGNIENRVMEKHWDPGTAARGRHST
jgi:hypothetical protein